MHWANDSTYPPIAKIMPRNRYIPKALRVIARQWQFQKG